MLTFFTADDTNIGRMRPCMLSDQQMMELFITPIDADWHEIGLGNDRDTACTWSGVTCSSESTVSSIDWNYKRVSLNGSITFSMLPSQLQSLIMVGQHDLRGPMDTTSLPETLLKFQIMSCGFHGTLDMGSLPRALCFFHVQNNEVTEIVNLRNLPEGLTKCRIQETNLTHDTLIVGKLGAGSTEIDLYRCGFENFKFADPADESRIVHDF